MKKWAVFAVVLLLGVLGVSVFLLNRPQVPQRDYLAEYAALIEERFPDGQDGVGEFEALVALDRQARVRAIVLASVERAIERAALEGLKIDLVEADSLAAIVLWPGRDPMRWPYEEAQRATAERVLREARAEAIPLVLDLLMDPAWRSAVAALGSHDTVVIPALPGTTLFERTIDHLLETRANAQTDAAVLRFSNNEAARLEALRSMLGMARASSSTPLIFGGLVQVAIEALVYAITLDALAGKAEPIGNPRAWLAEFNRHATLRPDASWHFAGERLIVLDLVEAEYTKRAGAAGLNTRTTLPVVGISHWRIYTILNEFHEAQAEAAARMPGERHEAPPDPVALLERVDFRARPLLEVVLVLPAPVRAIAIMDRIDAELIGTTTALALACYQADHGVWPGSLEDLVPEYLDAQPIDPYSAGAAEPLVYRVDTQGTVWLYSRGPDLTDNGGVRASRAGVPEAGEDLVFWPRPD